MTTKSVIHFPALARSLAIVATSLLPGAVLSDEIVLKSADGSVNLVGELIEFTDDNYTIQTALGDFTIAASRIFFEGEACPELEPEVADVAFAGADTVGLGMMPLLLAGYASFLEAESNVKQTDGAGEYLTSFVGDGGFGDELGAHLVTPTTSGDAFSSLLQKSAQIGMASRRIQPPEARELKADGAGSMISPLQEHVVAVDSLVVIVNPENAVHSITIEQLRGIYSGTITNWSELGGADSPIAVFDRQASSGTRSVFMNAGSRQHPMHFPPRQKSIHCNAGCTCITGATICPTRQPNSSSTQLQAMQMVQ